MEAAKSVSERIEILTGLDRPAKDGMIHKEQERIDITLLHGGVAKNNFSH
jgi:hypothetical protein